MLWDLALSFLRSWRYFVLFFPFFLFSCLFDMKWATYDSKLKNQTERRWIKKWLWVSWCEVSTTQFRISLRRHSYGLEMYCLGSVRETGFELSLSSSFFLILYTTLFCHLLCAQLISTPWMPSRRDSPKVCTIVSIWTILAPRPSPGFSPSSLDICNSHKHLP